MSMIMWRFVHEDRGVLTFRREFSAEDTKRTYERTKRHILKHGMYEREFRLSIIRGLVLKHRTSMGILNPTNLNQ